MNPKVQNWPEPSFKRKKKRWGGVEWWEEETTEKREKYREQPVR